MEEPRVLLRSEVGIGFRPVEALWAGRGQARGMAGTPARHAAAGAAPPPIALAPWSTLPRMGKRGDFGETSGNAATESLPGRALRNRQEEVTVVVCDPLPLLAQGLAKLLEEESSLLHVVSVQTNLEGARRSIAELSPVVAIIGLSADRAEDFAVVRGICSDFPGTRVVALLLEHHMAVASGALAGAGIAGYALKEREAAEIADVVSLVARGHVVAPASVAFPPEEDVDLELLEDLERELLAGVARSETNRDLAARLHLSERTVCRRLEAIYAKLGLNDRLQAAVYAATHGVVTRANWRSPRTEASGD